MDIDLESPPWTLLAGILLEATGDEVAKLGQPLWVRVEDPPDGLDGDFSLDFESDSVGFLGWTAPPEVQALGVVATGRAHALESPHHDPVPGFAPGSITPLRMACVVARDGTIGWKMAGASAFGHAGGGPRIETPPSEGRVLDTLRRALGLATPPAPDGPSSLMSTLWLAAIEEAAQTSTRRLTWTQVLDLHPAGTGDSFPNGDHSWEVMRLSAASTGWTEPEIHRELAAWMDDGMFARWILDAIRSPEEVPRLFDPT